MQKSLRDVGSFSQAGEVGEGPAHPQTDEEELGDELEEDEELLVASVEPLTRWHAPVAFFSSFH